MAGRRLAQMVVIVVLVLIGSVAYGQKTEQQQKAMAARAAVLDAYRKLAEVIKGFSITSQTTVRDFVAESDQINTSFTHFIKGIKTGKPRFYDDGMVEVDAEVALEQVVTELKRIVKRYYKGDRWKDVTFEDIKKYVKYKTVKATGAGCIPEEDDKGTHIGDWGDTEKENYISRPPSRGKSLTAGIPFWDNVTGQGKLMARLAARRDAQRKIAEMVKGIKITSETSVKDFVAESDTIETELRTFIKGIKETSVSYTGDGVVMMEMELTIERVITELERLTKRYYKGERWKEKTFEKIKKHTERKVVKAIGMGVPSPKYIKKGKPPVAPPPPPEETKPVWSGKTLKATGSGVAPEDTESEAQGRLLGEKAAEADAKRKLTEQIFGFRIDAKTTVRDFVTESDEINTEVNSFIRGVKQVGDTRFFDDGTVEVDVEISLDDLYNIVKKYRK